MSRQHATKERGPRFAGADARQRLLAGLPVIERRLQPAGVPTAVLEGGDGPPIVLLQGEFAAVWTRVIPELVTTHRVIAPDLPGLGASGVSARAGGEGPWRRPRRSFHDRPQRPDRSTGAGGLSFIGVLLRPTEGLERGFR